MGNGTPNAYIVDAPGCDIVALTPHKALRIEVKASNAKPRGSDVLKYRFTTCKKNTTWAKGGQGYQYGPASRLSTETCDIVALVAADSGVIEFVPVQKIKANTVTRPVDYFDDPIITKTSWAAAISYLWWGNQPPQAQGYK